MQEIAIVSGGNVFIGSHLTDHLIASGYDVIVPIRKTSDLSFLNKKAKTILCDIENPAPLEPFIKEATYIFHLAGLTKASSQDLLYRINTQATGRFAEYCSELKRKKPLTLCIPFLTGCIPRHPHAITTK
jgi:nucleoside-diphosphate-sugar epimerase